MLYSVTQKTSLLDLLAWPTLDFCRRIHGMVKRKRSQMMAEASVLIASHLCVWIIPGGREVSIYAKVKCRGTACLRPTHQGSAFVSPASASDMSLAPDQDKSKTPSK